MIPGKEKKRVALDLGTPCSIVLILLFQFVLLEWSAKPVTSVFAFSDYRYLAVALCTIAFFDLAVFLITNSIALSFSLVALLLFVISGINYYTYLFHGEPFTLEDIKNLKTATTVISTYRIGFDKRIAELFVIFLVIVAISFFVLRKQKARRTKALGICAVPLVIVLTVLYLGYFRSVPLIPENPVQWSWEHALREYGYTTSFVQQSICGLNAVDKPDHYDQALVEKSLSAFSSPEKTRGKRPDIIVILNETYYDMDLIIDTGITSVQVDRFQSSPNLICGYATSPKIGGGTNKSEYELLTSNSLRLIPIATPFASLDLQDANSIVKYLNSLGYISLGTHPYIASNYNRDSAYPKLGFDIIKWKDDYTNEEYYGNRSGFLTDSCVYANLIRWYEEQTNCDSTSPLLMYCLTIQNQGGYDDNPPALDIVRSPFDFSEDTETLDEFLSCIALSNRAFRALIDYYEDVDRDVIIVMTGDHCPSFAAGLSAQYGKCNDDNDLNLKLISTPFMIWSNNQELLNPELDGKTISKNYLLPLVLQAAGVELTGYYQKAVELEAQVPILTSLGVYYDSNGTMYAYDEQTPYSDRINEYFSYEYYSIKNPTGYSNFYN